MWIDLTPEGFSGAVIRNIAVGYSYVVLDGAYYRLGEGDDGKGLIDAVLCDLNGDDEEDLLYTYHFGTKEDGETKVGWFDCAEKTNAVSSFGMRNDYLAICEENGAYAVYRCSRAVDAASGEDSAGSEPSLPSQARAAECPRAQAAGREALSFRLISFGPWRFSLMRLRTYPGRAAALRTAVRDGRRRSGGD